MYMIALLWLSSGLGYGSVQVTTSKSNPWMILSLQHF